MTAKEGKRLEGAAPFPAGPPREGDAYNLFLNLFSRHHRQILAYLYGLLHNHHDADDVFQRTSLVLWSKFGDFRPGSNFMAWACRIAFLQTCNFLRTSSRDRLRFSDDLLKIMAEERLDYQQEGSRRAKALTACINKLTGRQRDLVRKAYDRDRPIHELAGQLGLAVQTVYNQLNSIRRTLFECVEQRLSGGET